MSTQYEFLSRWRVEGTCGEVADILGDAPALARWWPSVYLHVEELEPPDARGLGRRVRLHTRGWLPYTITWEFEIVESNYPHGFALVATGDFDGRGIWAFEQDGPFVNIAYAGAALVGGAVVIGASLAYLMLRSRRRSH